MKIFFRHLLLEFLGPLLFCLAAGSALWVIADLFGTLDDFVSKKAPWTVILKFYGAQLPNMLVVVLPMAVLFASLFTLLQLTRHQELVAMQAGGISPMALFLPFFSVTALLSIALFYIHGWPATQAEARRERLLLYMRGSLPDTDVYDGILFHDSLQKRLWYVQSLNLRTGHARGMEVLSRNAAGADVEKVFAQEGLWNGKSWNLANAKSVRFAADGSIAQSILLPTLAEPGWTMAPRELAMSQANPEELTLMGLARFLQRSHDQSRSRLAPYRTQFWQCWIYPSTLLTFLVFAFAYGTPTSRQRGASNVFGAVFVLIGYFFAMHFFLAMGRGGRMPGFMAAATPFLLFGGWGAYKLSRHWHLDTLAEFHWRQRLEKNPNPFLLKLEARRVKLVGWMERLSLLSKD